MLDILPSWSRRHLFCHLCRLDTGVVGRVKPFAIEIRNVKCAKCGGFGHQSGDRECPLKDVITPNELERLKRNDPLQAIIAQATGDEVHMPFVKLYHTLL